MPNGSSFDVLTLRGSSVTRLPSGLNANQIDLTKSAVTSIGRNIQAVTLYIDSTDMLSSPIACNSCIVKPDGASQPYFGRNNRTEEIITRLNMKNVVANRLRVITSKGNYHISQAIADKCFLSAYEGQLPGTYTIEDAEFDIINLEISNGSTVVLNNVKSNHLIINSTPKDKVLANLAIRNSVIDQVKLSGSLKDFRLLELTLHGSMQIKGESHRSTPRLPDFGLVTGDIEMPSAISLPFNLCCLGSVTRI